MKTDGRTWLGYFASQSKQLKQSPTRILTTNLFGIVCRLTLAMHCKQRLAFAAISVESSAHVCKTFNHSTNISQLSSVSVIGEQNEHSYLLHFYQCVCR